MYRMKEEETRIATTEEGEEETVFIENTKTFEKNNNSTKGTRPSYRGIKERVSSKSLLVKVWYQ